MNDARPERSLAEIMIDLVDGLDRLNTRLEELEMWAVSQGFQPCRP